VKELIPMKVIKVHEWLNWAGTWACDVTFELRGQSVHNSPTLTVESGRGLERPPRVGDVLMVRPPEVVGFAPPSDESDDSDKSDKSDQVRPVCEACGGPGPLSEVTDKLWPPHLCASCVRTYSERVGKAAPPAPG
jgi:hypothetical protein